MARGGKRDTYGKGEMSETDEKTEGSESDEKAEAAQKSKQESEDAREEIKALEENPPDKLEDWPGGKAMYETFGGPSEEKGYEEAATAKLGPSGLRRFEDGSIEINGEKVDNPEDYKGDPIPGGPTDPDAPAQPGESAKNDDDDNDDEAKAESESDDAEDDA
jgi:hypothetical protein